ncbi:class I SAM-dependent methyltransferase [Streptomyces alkaliphilus]|nr:methyltransferase domain-containing protein [Streptomyces alkaliphilus]
MGCDGWMTTDEERAEHVEANRAYWNDRGVADHGPLAREHWAAPEPRWGLWRTPESELSVFPPDVAGKRVIELGCGTGYVSAWLSRAGAHPTGIDISEGQLEVARRMAAEFGLDFPLVHGDAERLPYGDGEFDLAISEYGASLWCDPHRWIPEAARVLCPGGRLVFLRPSPLFALCAADEGPAGPRLLRPQFGTSRLDWGRSFEFTLPHGEMLRLLRSRGFEVEDLVEIQAPEKAHREYDYLTAEWARSWPCEELWRARLR